MIPKISIIMPSLNVAPYIKECMDSVLQQTEKDIEIISIDAGSTDGTWEILEEYAEADNRIKLIKSNIRSYGAQVNQGIKVARGKYVAILETDDYIAPEMYGSLYDLAEENQVDYVKADYDSFITLTNADKLFETNHFLKDKPELYNKVIVPRDYNILYIRDFNLWKGVFKKSFLIENCILLNESPGAAYQDIGFSELVLSHAKRAYYTDASFYRYRLDREEASSNSVKGLWNVYREFRRLLETQSLFEQISNKKGLYLHMATAFLGEYEKAIRKVSYDCQSEEISEAYEWLKSHLKKAIENSLIEEEDLDIDSFNILNQVLDSQEDYAKDLAQKEKIMNSRLDVIAKKGKESGVVIFGAGNYGLTALKYLDRNNIKVKAFTDNNMKLIGTKIGGIQVLSLKDCLRIYSKELYVIANKYHGETMRQQYISEGGSIEQVELM